MGMGRPKGSLNFKTRAILPLTEQLKSFNFDIVKELLVVYDELDDPMDRANVLMRLMDFVYPRKRTVEVTERPSKETLAEWVREYLSDESTTEPIVQSLPGPVPDNSGI